MSTVISCKNSDKTYTLRYILRYVKKSESLADYVRRVMFESNLAYRQVAARSGEQISAGYVSDIIKQKTINPSVAKLKALARGLGKSEEEVIAVARGKALDETSLESANLRAFLADVERLNPVDKAYFMETLKIFHNEVRARLEKYDTPAAKATTERDLDLEAFVDYVWQLHPEIEIATICYVLENRLEHLGGVAMEDVDTIRSLHAEFTNKTVIKNSA